MIEKPQWPTSSRISDRDYEQVPSVNGNFPSSYRKVSALASEALLLDYYYCWLSGGKDLLRTKMRGVGIRGQSRG